ncbi:hypothetical protein PN36_30550, partial [Candidatus Thiomargarita nelsonii]
MTFYDFALPKENHLKNTRALILLGSAFLPLFLRFLLRSKPQKYTTPIFTSFWDLSLMKEWPKFLYNPLSIGASPVHISMPYRATKKFH